MDDAPCPGHQHAPQVRPSRIVSKPCSFEDAVRFVRKVKDRFGSKPGPGPGPGIYQTFLNTIHAYHKEEGEVSRGRVVGDVFALFEGHPDLLQGFANFLPTDIQPYLDFTGENDFLTASERLFTPTTPRRLSQPLPVPPLLPPPPGDEANRHGSSEEDAGQRVGITLNLDADDTKSCKSWTTVKTSVTEDSLGSWFRIEDPSEQHHGPTDLDNTENNPHLSPTTLQEQQRTLNDPLHTLICEGWISSCESVKEDVKEDSFGFECVTTKYAKLFDSNTTIGGTVCSAAVVDSSPLLCFYLRPTDDTPVESINFSTVTSVEKAAGDPSSLIVGYLEDCKKGFQSKRIKFTSPTERDRWVGNLEWVWPTWNDDDANLNVVHDDVYAKPAEHKNLSKRIHCKDRKDHEGYKDGRELKRVIGSREKKVKPKQSNKSKRKKTRKAGKPSKPSKRKTSVKKGKKSKLKQPTTGYKCIDWAAHKKRLNPPGRPDWANDPFRMQVKEPKSMPDHHVMAIQDLALQQISTRPANPTLDLAQQLDLNLHDWSKNKKKKTRTSRRDYLFDIAILESRGTADLNALKLATGLSIVTEADEHHKNRQKALKKSRSLPTSPI
ncbi:hypothetical protein AAMO2058_001362400 [Amorphochlora amoebiformis]